MSGKMSEPETSKQYDLWAKFYDNSFGALVHKRQVKAIEQVPFEAGDRVLDIGVGTGMTLSHYPDNVKVVGMDLSGGMLSKAVAKKRELGLEHCHLVQGDAMHPPFAAGSFDHVVISHTISVVSEPNRLMRWARRLVKPDGRIVVLNHFQSGNRFIGWWEQVLNPMFVKIGWRSDLTLQECLDGVDVKVLYQFKLTGVDFWRIVVLEPTQ